MSGFYIEFQTEEEVLGHFNDVAAVPGVGEEIFIGQDQRRVVRREWMFNERTQTMAVTVTVEDAAR